MNCKRCGKELREPRPSPIEGVEFRAICRDCARKGLHEAQKELEKHYRSQESLWGKLAEHVWTDLTLEEKVEALREEQMKTMITQPGEEGK